MAEIRNGDTVVVAGTKKGLFLFLSRDRREWRGEGPLFPGQPILHALLDPRDGRTLWAGVTTGHWGATVQRSEDFGKTWTQGDSGPRFPEESDLSVERIWQVRPGVDEAMYAGTEPAGLFRSDDDGQSWTSVEGLNAWPDRASWQPGFGGLCLHTILPHPRDARSLQVGISAVGVFGTDDAGATWERRNAGIRSFVPGQLCEEETGTCVHKMARDAQNPALVYQQNHIGVYRRKEGEAAWTRIEEGLPVNESRGAPFGFPVAAHPHDAGTAYAVPLDGDDNRVVPGGAMAVYRTRDGGRAWERLSDGFPQREAWYTVLRDGLRTDAHDPAGVYVGTTTGQLYASRDEGDSWELLRDRLPPILSVEVGVVGGG